MPMFATLQDNKMCKMLAMLYKMYNNLVVSGQSA